MFIHHNVYIPPISFNPKEKLALMRSKVEHQAGNFREVIKLTISEKAQEKFAEYLRPIEYQINDDHDDHDDQEIDESATLSTISHDETLPIVRQMKRMYMEKQERNVENREPITKREPITIWSQAAEAYKLHVRKVYR